MTFSQILDEIRTPDYHAMAETQRRLDSIIKPLDSLGILERHLVKIAGMTGEARFDFSRKAVVVFCADNGVVAQGVTQSDKEITAIVAENLTTGQTCVCNMARVAGAEVIPVDIGIDGDLEVPGLWNYKVAYGTLDFTQGPAMTLRQAEQAVRAGIEVADKLCTRGYRMLATGEMGIGNTTTAAALAAVMLDLPVEQVTGRGAGLSDERLGRKISVIKQAIALNAPNPDDGLELLSKLGGLDIAGMAGLCIGGALAGVPVVLDGFISCVAAMIACRMNPLVKEYLLPSHISSEPAGKAMLERLGLEAPLHAYMRLGEGTGAVATFPLYDMILGVYNNMVVFDDEEMAPYERYR